MDDFLVGGIILLFMVCMYLIRLYNYQQETIKKQLDDINKLISSKKQSEVRLGQISEHFAPLLKDFPYDSKNVRFLGSPIDFVVFEFEQEKIVFIEFKTGNSKESSRQRTVRKIIESGNVEYKLMTVNEEVTIK
jgi:predicted Holliday junction resolvase-like endonuclease